MGGKITLGAAVLSVALGGFALAAEFKEDMAKAKKWDYTGQRNVAWSYMEGDGVEKNSTESCAWRVVIVMARGVDVTDSDTINLEGCERRGYLTESLERAKGLLQMLPARPKRTAQRDVDELREEWCGNDCSKERKAFFDQYIRAARGEDRAMKAVALCFAGKCEGIPVDTFKACLWTKEYLRSSPSDPDLKSIHFVACRSDTKIFPIAVEQHLRAIREMRASRRS